jgi:hypothetical protein
MGWWVGKPNSAATLSNGVGGARALAGSVVMSLHSNPAHEEVAPIAHSTENVFSPASPVKKGFRPFLFTLSTRGILAPLTKTIKTTQHHDHPEVGSGV